MKKSLQFSFALLTMVINPANGQVSQTGAEQADITIQRFLDREISRTVNADKAANPPGRVEVSVGQIDPRLQLAPCARIEPQLPTNVRLWGKVNVMLRCVEGANWNVSLPVTVRVFGSALTATRSLSANEIIRATDVELQEVELSRETGSPVTTITQLDQKTLGRPVSVGTVLRQEWFRALPVITAGDTIRVIATGSGFSITSDGQALNSAIEGQSVRIKTDSGRVIAGTARSGRIAEIRF